MSEKKLYDTSCVIKTLHALIWYEIIPLGVYRGFVPNTEPVVAATVFSAAVLGIDAFKGES